MSRRSMLAATSGSALLFALSPILGKAQTPGRAFRIGVLGVGTAEGLAPRMQLFRSALREHGWVADSEVRYVERYADGDNARLRFLAAELVEQKVDLILAAGGSPAVVAAMQVTKEIPIVFPTAGDPVGQKLVTSMAHPGGNVTGLSLMSSELYAKRLELLRELLPGIKRIGLLGRDGNPNSAEFLRASRAAAQVLAIDVDYAEVREPRDYERVFGHMARGGAQGVLMLNDPILEVDLPRIAAQALKHRLALVAGYRRPGVLIAYGSSGPDAFYVRAAYYVDRILRGAKPGDLPVEQSSRIPLVIDLRVAQALGLTVPKTLLLRADEVIQ